MTTYEITENLVRASADLNAVLHEESDPSPWRGRDLSEIAGRFLEAASGFLRSHRVTLADIDNHIRYEDFAYEAAHLSSLLQRHREHAGPYIVAPIYRIIALLIDAGLVLKIPKEAVKPLTRTSLGLGPHG